MLTEVKINKTKTRAEALALGASNPGTVYLCTDGGVVQGGRLVSDISDEPYRLLYNNGDLLLESAHPVSETLYLLREVSRRRTLEETNESGRVYWKRTISKSYQAFCDSTGDREKCQLSLTLVGNVSIQNKRYLYKLGVNNVKLKDVLKSRLVRSDGTIRNSHGAYNAKSTCVKLAVASGTIVREGNTRTLPLYRYNIIAKAKMHLIYISETSTGIGFEV